MDAVTVTYYSGREELVRIRVNFHFFFFSLRTEITIFSSAIVSKFPSSQDPLLLKK